MPVFLRFRTRIDGDAIDECWDEGGRSRSKTGYVGGGYFRTTHRGAKYIRDIKTIGLQGVPEWQYPSALITSLEPDPYQFEFDSETEFNPFVFDADSFGATAWNRMRPDRPKFGLTNALIELREYPQLLKPRILQYRDTKAWADYFLAVNFGWLPILSDAQNFVKQTINMHDNLQQLIRDEGRPVHRRVVLNDSVKTQIRNGQGYSFYLGVPLQVYNGVPTYTDTFEYGTRTWAVGKFRYYLPPGPRNMAWRANQMRKALGLQVSPSVVWNAIPWSWLADWFTNAGDILENIDYTVAERLVAEYAFIMQRKVRSFSRTTSGSFFTPGGSTTSAIATTILRAESKERSIIDPFGPSVSGENLSDMQSAILGAIGITRMPSSAGSYRPKYYGGV